MSEVVKLASKLPGGKNAPEIDGLDAQVARLIERPDDFLVCLVWLDTQKVTHDTDSGEDVPTVRIRKIEPLGDAGAVAEAVRAAADKAAQARLGRRPIPFEQATVSEGFDPDQATIEEA